jgi:hypothetical protein
MLNIGNKMNVCLGCMLYVCSPKMSAEQLFGMYVVRMFHKHMFNTYVQQYAEHVTLCYVKHMCV